MKKLLFILLFFFLSINVYALDKTDSFYSGDWIPNVYINKVKSGIIHYRQARFIRRKSDGGVAYCIEPFQDMKTNGSYNGYDIEKIEGLKIDKNVFNKVKLIAYYGYGYSGHSDSKWYAITQVMIWREVDKNAQFYFTDSLNGNKINKYDSEINEINALINKHYILPSFANKEYDFSIDSINTLLDKNNVLNNYNVTQNETLDIKKDSNTLLVNTNSEGYYTLEFTRKFNNHPVKTYLFVDETYQNIITPGNIEDITFKLNIKVQGGKIKIIKLDSDSNSKEPSGEGVLVGSEFEIYNNSVLVDTLIIDENNEAISKLLPFGEYVVKESKSMDGYLLNQNEYTISINEDNSLIEIEFKNQIKKTELKIIKYFDDKLEEGISFEIYNKNGDLVDTLTTNDLGEINYELSYGTYIFHQLNSTKNYRCVDDFEINVNMDIENVIQLELHDEKYSSKVEIIKRDSSTGKIIKDETIFKIYDIDKERYINLNGIEELKTIDGKLTIEDLTAGEYYLEEYKAPKGYKKSDDKVKIVVDDSNEEEIINVNFYDEVEEIQVEVPNTNQDYKIKIYALVDNKKRKLTNMLS